MANFNNQSADYQAGVSAGAHRLGDFLIQELKGQVSNDVLALIEAKKWEFVEKHFEEHSNVLVDF